MWSTCPEGTTAAMKGAAVFRIASICSATCSIDHAPRYTPGDSAIKALATRPAIEISISPEIEQDSCASQPTTGATSSGDIGGYALVSNPSAILVTAPGTMRLHFTPSAAPSSATTLDKPIRPALAPPQ